MSIRQLIATTELELEISMENDSLSFVLYTFADQMFYREVFKKSTLPEMILLLYEEIDHFFQYIASIANTPNPSLLLRFHQSILYVKDYICRGMSEV
jgi:hypothetical protein